MRSRALIINGSLIKGHLHTFKAGITASTLPIIRVPLIPGRHEGLLTRDEGWQDGELCTKTTIYISLSPMVALS